MLPVLILVLTIIETVDKLEKVPTEVAVNILKTEFRRRQVGIRK